MSREIRVCKINDLLVLNSNNKVQTKKKEADD